MERRSGTTVRHARPSELRHLAALEDSGAAQFVELFGSAAVPALLAPAPSGLDRALQPGFVLVVGEPAYGFAHVVLHDGAAHLEQLSVHPARQRQGHGAVLVRAAMEEARWSGHGELTLCTYRDVAWNGPFYRALGFTEVDEPARWLAALLAHERELGLHENGVRVAMRIALRNG